MEYSVLMTVYKNDNPAFFESALKSMVNQTMKADEIVIVKDGPISEGLQNVINQYNKCNNIIELQLERNVGLGLALNEGLKICKNELIARMDADDISLPTRCEKQVAAFELELTLDIVGLYAKEFQDNVLNIVGERRVPLTNEGIYKFAKTRDPFNHPTVMYKKSKVLAVGMYGDFRKNQDTELWIKLLSNNANCMNLDDDLFRFRFDSNTYKKRKSWINAKLLIQIRYHAFQTGFCSFYDLCKVAIASVGMFLIPKKIQEVIYRKILR